MDLDQASRWRSIAGRLGSLLCFLAFLALLDGLSARFREPESLIKLLPGMSAEINGPLQGEVRSVKELVYLSDSDDLKVSFTTVHKGYFLGGDMWRGQIMVSPAIKPGEYHVSVAPRWSTSKEATPAFRILVFADPLSLQRSSKSLVRRYTSFSPWGAAAACLPLILLAFAAVFLLSQKMDSLLARQGRAEIYRVVRKDGVYEIRFGLGTAHGVHPGLELQVYNPQGQAVALARVEESAQEDAMAVVTADQEVRPGYMVSRKI